MLLIFRLRFAFMLIATLTPLRRFDIFRRRRCQRAATTETLRFFRC